jgi:hypothetical protein
LDQARIDRGAGDLPEIRRSAEVQAHGDIELAVIESVKKFRVELQECIFVNTSHLGGFRESGGEVELARNVF